MKIYLIILYTWLDSLLIMIMNNKNNKTLQKSSPSAKTQVDLKKHTNNLFDIKKVLRLGNLWKYIPWKMTYEFAKETFGF